MQADPANRDDDKTRDHRVEEGCDHNRQPNVHLPGNQPEDGDPHKLASGDNEMDWDPEWEAGRGGSEEMTECPDNTALHPAKRHTREVSWRGVERHGTGGAGDLDQGTNGSQG